ncbi:MAG: hypothetical protein FJX30_01845 [Alphaproteobacteria bacterium]|nr:hypothetical protein [Alphaproteobacteria bacterium]
MNGSFKNSNIYHEICDFIKKNNLKIIRQGNPPSFNNKKSQQPEILEITEKLKIIEKQEIVEKNKAILARKINFINSEKYSRQKHQNYKHRHNLNSIKTLSAISEESEDLKGFDEEIPSSHLRPISIIQAKDLQQQKNTSDL